MAGGRIGKAAAMMRRVWLASYPKSGNTWVRMLLGALAAGPEAPLDINDPPTRWGIASGRESFELETLLDSDLFTHEEVDRLRPRIFEQMARDDRAASGPAPRFAKTHDAYLPTLDGEPLLAGARGADGAILVLRDPRAVAPSLANHLGVAIDEAIRHMSDEAFCFSSGVDRRPPQFRQRLSSWSGHAASWLDQTDLPVLALRYEDLSADPCAALRGILDFAGWRASPEEIARAVARASFSELQRQERESGFREAPRERDRKFFRRGRPDAWREELTRAQIAQVEREHAAMMRRLGYEFHDPRAGANG